MLKLTKQIKTFKKGAILELAKRGYMQACLTENWSEATVFIDFAVILAKLVYGKNGEDTEHCI